MPPRLYLCPWPQESLFQNVCPFREPRAATSDNTYSLPLLKCFEEVMWFQYGPLIRKAFIYQQFFLGSMLPWSVYTVGWEQSSETK